jgi:hypothetical protein
MGNTVAETVLSSAEKSLKRDLQGMASDLKWSAVELVRIAERLSLASNDADAQALLRMRQIFHAGENRLTGYADEVETRRIVRGKAEQRDA